MIEGKWDLYYWPLIKINLICCLFAVTQRVYDNYLISLGICVITIMYYQHLVALYHGKIVMSTMDNATYLSNKNSIVNFMNFSTYDNDNIEIIR